MNSLQPRCCTAGLRCNVALDNGYTIIYVSDQSTLVSYTCHLWCLFSLGTESLSAVIDGYTPRENFAAGDEVRLGRQVILVCRVVGLSYGTPLSYTWTCPNGPCEVEGYYGRKIYNEHILAVNTTSTSDGGTYTCRVTATGGSVQQEARARFRFTVVGELSAWWTLPNDHQTANLEST